MESDANHANTTLEEKYILENQRYLMRKLTSTVEDQPRNEEEIKTHQDTNNHQDITGEDKDDSRENMGQVSECIARHSKYYKDTVLS